MAARRALPKSAFAVPSKAPGPGSYPIPDAAHAAVAKGRATQFASSAVKAKVDRKANVKLERTDSHGGMGYHHGNHSSHGTEYKHGDHPSAHPGLKYT